MCRLMPSVIVIMPTVVVQQAVLPLPYVSYDVIKHRESSIFQESLWQN